MQQGIKGAVPMFENKQIWVWVVLLPMLTFLCESVCIWSTPRFLGSVAQPLLTISGLTKFAVVAAVPASVYFAVTSVIYRKTKGELVRRSSKSLACICFVGLSIVAFGSSMLVRHRAFVHASLVGDRIVQALTRYRNDRGEYPEHLKQLVPDFIGNVPYTGMIGYPEFSYKNGYNDIQINPDGYELRINCSSGGINFDRFIYWPSETYPERIQGNGVERIGTWAYVHE
jgi:hypothetical protein